MNSIEDIWSSVLELMGSELTPVAMNTWFGESRAVGMTESSFTLYVPSDFKRSIINARFLGNIKEALRQIFAGEMEVYLVGDEELESSEPEPEREVANPDEYTFDKFVVGPSNKFAHAASLAVAEGQTTDYNPLFIYGDSGPPSPGVQHRLCPGRGLHE